MKSLRIALPVVCVLALGLSACETVHHGPIASAPALNYKAKVPGRYALHVSAEKVKGIFKFPGYECSAHEYPTDARAAFEKSASQTFENFSEHVEIVPEPLHWSALEPGGYDAVIMIGADDLNVEITFIDRLWNADVEAVAEISAKMLVEGRERRIIETSAEASAEGLAGLGGMCGGAEEAIAEAVEGAMRGVMEALGESFANSLDPRR